MPKKPKPEAEFCPMLFDGRTECSGPKHGARGMVRIPAEWEEDWWRYALLKAQFVRALPSYHYNLVRVPVGYEAEIVLTKAKG